MSRRLKRPWMRRRWICPSPQVRAPISGLVGRAEITAGNLVAAGQTLLTTLVSIDPIYVSFDGDEQVYLKYVGMDLRGERESSRNAQNPVWVGPRR